MRLTRLNGRIKDILTRTEIPNWVRWVLFILFTILWLAWFGGYFGF